MSKFVRTEEGNINFVFKDNKLQLEEGNCNYITVKTIYQVYSKNGRQGYECIFLQKLKWK